METRICTICDTEVEGQENCPHCINEANWRDVSKMTPEERITEFKRWETVQIPFDMVHKRIEQIVGRSVWTHEMTTAGCERLYAEILRGVPATFDDVIAATPEHITAVYVVETEE